MKSFQRFNTFFIFSGIPFGLGIAKSGRMLSLEHTHPPASLVLHGDRRGVQGKIKKSWIEKLVKA